MDDVLDSVRAVHLHGDVHGRVPVVVPLLLRGEDSAGAVAAVARHQGLLDTLQEVRSPRPLQARTGKYLHIPTIYLPNISAATIFISRLVGTMYFSSVINVLNKIRYL